MEDQVKKAYEHLEMLYDQLPLMEEKNRRFLESEGAEKVIAAEKRLRLLKQEYSRYETELREAEEKKDLGFQRVLGELLSIRTAPMLQAEKALKTALSESGFESAETAREKLLDPKEKEALLNEIESFKKAYEEALNNCQALEALLGEAD